MQYQLNKTNYKTFSMFADNKLAGRSYIIPFPDEAQAGDCHPALQRYHSDRVLMLSGEWDFQYYDKISAAPDVLDTQAAAFDKVPVPSTWQHTGYEKPYYVNTRYQFDLTPPDFPEDVPVGVYRKTFTVSMTGKKYLLNFLGAISSLDVYLNGAYVGYSEGAHNTAEFDVTALLKDGENELVCVVAKWSNGTYLECQDMFRDNGIFRDVFLIETKEAYLKDYCVTTAKTDGGYSMRVSLQVAGDASCRVSLRRDGAEIAAVTAPKGKESVEFAGLQVEEWSAELPHLYELWFFVEDGETLYECARTLTGFRHIEIKKDVFYFNGAKIKMKGVNHHDTDPKTGYVMTAEQLEQDVRLMKEYNVNTVRTSHYPPDPMFLIYCDIYGLYVVDEADIETHGCGDGEGKHAIDQISHDPQWEGHYLDRVARMYERDKNHPSITMWSLGNEAGGYHNQDACYHWLKKECPQVPIHYEAVSRTKRWAYDVVSEMYMPVGKLTAISRGVMGPMFNNKPYFLCEYAHAMGFGPGGLEDYMIRFYKSDRLLGGCIWEWADHAAYHAPGDGAYQYTYGGDHGEEKHDSNFCVDGLFYPDRTPHTGALEMKVCYRPVRARYKGKQAFVFTNTNRFRPSDDMEIRYEFLQDGKRAAKGVLPLTLAPLEQKACTIADAVVDTTKDNLMNFTYVEKETGRVVAWEQVALLEIVKELELDGAKDASFKEDGSAITVTFDGGTAVFDKASGCLTGYQVHGVEYVNPAPAGDAKGLSFQLFRAPLDNDMNVRKTWEALGYDQLTFRPTKVKAGRYGRQVRVKTAFRVTSPKKGLLFLASAVYLVDGTGKIKVSASLTRLHPAAVSLPRFGMHLELPKTFHKVAYYGRGPYENLSDIRVQAPAGIYRADVADMHEAYIKPQDSGSHTGTRWMKLTDEAGRGLMVVNSDAYFTFQAHHYTTGHLAAAGHREDLTGQDTTDLSIDGFLRGSGTNSCGPVPTGRHRISMAKPLCFSFVIKPV